MIDYTLSDEKIRDLWDKHYRERLNATQSRAICVTICGMVEDRAEAIKDKIGRWDRIAQALNHMGISISQYDQVKSEQIKILL